MEARLTAVRALWRSVAPALRMLDCTSQMHACQKIMAAESEPGLGQETRLKEQRSLPANRRLTLGSSLPL